MARFGHSSTGIGDITVDKGALIDTLQHNRETHHDTFVQACDRFRERALRELNDVIDLIESGQIPRYVGAQLPIPEEHTDDYDRAIAMLKRHTGDTIVLTEEAYARLVDDDWGWRDAFAANTASYVDTSRPPRRNDLTTAARVGAAML